MSLIKIRPDDIESFTVITNPTRSYVTSSSGATGSVYVYARRSTSEKDVELQPAFIDVKHDDSDMATALADLQQKAKVIRNTSGSGSIYGLFDEYLAKVDAQVPSVRKHRTVDIHRFTPTTSFTEYTLRKLVVKDQLMRHYRITQPSCHWAFTNYNTLNFFTSSTVPTGSALLYPNIDGNIPHDGYVSGTYSLSGAFSFDFHVNPRYQTDEPNGDFKAATLLHLTSSYAVSLITGSAKDENGRPLYFRLQLQLSHSADIAPSLAKPGAYPNDLVFLSDDNTLKWNNWHHVVIRWGTNLTNKGTGSFNVDGVDRGFFVVPSGTVAPVVFDPVKKSGPDVLVVGNYYEGTNYGVNSLATFFATDPAQRDGITELYAAASVDEPTAYSFRHPFKGEVHDVSLKRYYMTNTDIKVSASVGLAAMDERIAFYLPPFFVQDSTFRQFIGTSGGVLQTPFFEIDGTTDDPFNVALSFGVDGHYINIENYLKDFANGTFPRCHMLTASAITYTTIAKPANQFLYEDPRVAARNLLIMPCDDGNFMPNFDLLKNELRTNKLVDDDGVPDLSFVNLDNLVLTSSLLFGTDFALGTAVAGDDFIESATGPTPEKPGKPPGPAYTNFIRNVDASIADDTYDAGVQAGAPLTIYQRTRDPSSNQVTFFNVSNIFYGKSIKPGSLVITDPSLSGSAGMMKIRLRDDGRGNIYRADSETKNATWSSVGNVFYDEGIIVVKNPHLYFYGKEGYEITFKGVQNIHTLKLEVLAPSNMINSSSNPAFINVPASGYVTDDDPEFVYISGINFHDQDLNVVARTVLAQPIVKRHGARVLFKSTIDF